jgi:hypothetical protein
VAVVDREAVSVKLDRLLGADWQPEISRMSYKPEYFISIFLAVLLLMFMLWLIGVPRPLP